jgi:hypothetical protein
MLSTGIVQPVHEAINAHNAAERQKSAGLAIAEQGPSQAIIRYGVPRTSAEYGGSI